MNDFDLIVIGAGMFGAAAARHGAEATAATWHGAEATAATQQDPESSPRVALVGPDEPAEPASHTAPFASHHDAGRITRRLDPDPDWALIADRAIGRYGDLQARSGIDFHHKCGVLLLGTEIPDDRPFGRLVSNTRATCARMGLAVEELNAPALRTRFPEFDCETGFVGLFEAGDAGVIDPRRMVAAQIRCAQMAGARRFTAHAIGLEERADGVTVRLSDGTILTGAKVIVATGAYGEAGGLLPRPIGTKAICRTVTKFEISGAEAERLANMPCVIFAPRSRDSEPYLLPPVPYPDGKLWLKIGGEPHDYIAGSAAELQDWFRSGGRAEVMEYQTDMLRDLMPDIAFGARETAACVYTKTRSMRPIIEAQSARIVACLGGNGMGAKGSDEIGRLGATLALTGDLGADYEGGFTADDPASQTAIWPGLDG